MFLDSWASDGRGVGEMNSDHLAIFAESYLEVDNKGRCSNGSGRFLKAFCVATETSVKQPPYSSVCHSQTPA